MEHTAFEVQFFALGAYTILASGQSSEIFGCFWHSVAEKANHETALVLRANFDVEKHFLGHCIVGF